MASGLPITLRWVGYFLLLFLPSLPRIDGISSQMRLCKRTWNPTACSTSSIKIFMHFQGVLNAIRVLWAQDIAVLLLVPRKPERLRLRFLDCKRICFCIHFYIKPALLPFPTKSIKFLPDPGMLPEQGRALSDILRAF